MVLKIQNKWIKKDVLLNSWLTSTTNDLLDELKRRYQIPFFKAPS